MNILIINSGSSSLKYQIIEMPSEKVVCNGLIERIGQQNSKFVYNPINGEEVEIEETIADHKQGLSILVSYLFDEKLGVLKSKKDIKIIGHRVVHGGNKFSKTRIVTPEVKAGIKELFSLAPLHNPAHLLGIEVCEELFPETKQIVVFDTAFHQTMPSKAYKYALPKKLTEEKKIRVYGFHGTSHKYVSEKANEFLGTTNTKLITLHIGNGASVSAVENGKCVDHSMGFSPTTGLVMGTRIGDIDPSVVLHLIKNLGYSVDEVSDLLIKKSGMLGMTGYSDFRDLVYQSQNGNTDCTEALELYAYRVKKYIGSYTAAMNGLDALVFTAGAGENSIELRKLICENLSFLGIELDEDLNNVRPKELIEIQAKNSKVKILIIPTNEELEIAKQCFELI
ncbi:acetate/propionate family kinase [Wenyingzhuangia marina]|uniref:Acetate kinase n=1 Tax=Wenyingzhuangia marina TaxID=1195760 RepID=A0A1M5W2T3_9FLAO|nr:acetate kinase [Wenyingzhuangia marina]GGF76351.1 acetate kinase [Wenyingzhuangia marina]SHH81750.1 acetate kinase [Wenyingzhuangia marina]